MRTNEVSDTGYKLWMTWKPVNGDQTLAPEQTYRRKTRVPHPLIIARESTGNVNIWLLNMTILPASGEQNVILPSHKGNNCMIAYQQQEEEQIPIQYSPNEPQHDKTDKMSVRPANTRSAWAKDPRFLHADSEYSDQTGRMPRLIWVFAGTQFCWFCKPTKWVCA